MPGFEDFDRLLVVTGMTRELRTELAHQTPEAHRFAQLPFVALRAGHRWSQAAPTKVGVVHTVTPTALGLLAGIDRVLNYVLTVRRLWGPNGNRFVSPETEADPSHFILERDGEEVRARGLPALLVPCRLAYPGLLNMSVQLKPGRVFTADEPLAIATRIAATHLPVVVAAGNWKHAGPFDTLSPLARLPWNISVGATADEAGTTLCVKSSGGSEEPPESSIRAPGPTVVAYGENSFVPGEFGTSYAAPRASRQLLMMAGFLLQITACLIREDGQLSAVPLLVRASIDRGFKDFVPKPVMVLPHQPSGGIDLDAARRAIAILREAGFERNLDPRPADLRRMLVASARPMAGFSQAHVGAGLVGDDSTVEYLTSFTGLDYARTVWPDGAERIPSSQVSELANLRLADSTDLTSILAIARDSALPYAFDFGNGRVHSATPEGDVMQQDPSTDAEPDSSFWPPAIPA